MILPVIAYGDPVLRAECQEIEEGTDMTQLLKDMHDTMYDASGVGLAAIKISYFDEKWDFHEEEYTGVAARIIQHEYDHIEGILFTATPVYSSS